MRDGRLRVNVCEGEHHVVVVIAVKRLGAVRGGVVLSGLCWVWKQGRRTLAALDLMSAFG